MSEIKKFRKKPVVIEAVQFSGDNWSEIGAFTGILTQVDEPGTLSIHTLEGTLTASQGDWIIKGVKGEFYPCKPDIFAATYEPADSRDPAKLDALLEAARNAIPALDDATSPGLVSDIDLQGIYKDIVNAKFRLKSALAAFGANTRSDSRDPAKLDALLSHTRALLNAIKSQRNGGQDVLIAAVLVDNALAAFEGNTPPEVSE